MQFNADVSDGMPWKFTPTQNQVFPDAFMKDTNISNCLFRRSAITEGCFF